jgi:hypothetical protein
MVGYLILELYSCRLEASLYPRIGPKKDFPSKMRFKLQGIPGMLGSGLQSAILYVIAFCSSKMIKAKSGCRSRRTDPQINMFILSLTNGMKWSDLRFP